eukprot:UN05136
MQCFEFLWFRFHILTGGFSPPGVAFFSPTTLL